MPTAGTARGYTGSHATSGYDVSARRSAKSGDSGSNRKVKRSSKRGGRK